MKKIILICIAIVLLPKVVFAKDWGLGFEKEGDIPRGNETSEYLQKYDAYYIGGGKNIYFTFDAGYENGYTEIILDILKIHNVPGAFFLTGNYFKTNPHIIRRMVNEGHIVANHTMTHKDMSKLSNEDFEKELDGVNEVFKEIIGEDIPKYYRPPNGKYSEENLKTTQRLGYKTIFWSLAYKDWHDDKQPSSQEAFEKLVPRVHDGTILLLHNTSKTNVLILEDLIIKYKDLGYNFKSLDDLENDVRSNDIQEISTQAVTDEIEVLTKSTGALPLSGKVVLIDAGHGEFDPGKVGARNTLEKDINLAISLKLQALLETSDAYVLLTRSEDKALGSTKNADMAGRRHIANTGEADILLSIHQNSFNSGGPVGPMVFHYSDEGESKALATSIQKHMNNELGRSSGRKPKKNKNYYVLRTTTMPAVIIECGFLTNSWDLDSLRQEEYQNKVAWSIYKGVLEYFGQLSDSVVS